VNRYAAKLLFQFRVMVDGDPGKRRLCEERIVVFRARSADDALRLAKREGIDCQHEYTNAHGNPVHFEFVGVLELLCLDPACEPDEVWYDIVERLLPMERKGRLLPAEHDLEAIRNRRWEGRERRHPSLSRRRRGRDS